MQIVEQIKDGDKTKIREYMYMRAAFKARIEELNDFYDKHSTEPQIHLFEKLRLRIKKALHKKVEVGQLMGQSAGAVKQFADGLAAYDQ